MEKNGVVRESNKEYHAYKGAVSKSRLANMAICPAYFKYMEEHEELPTEALTVGSAFHKVVLEADEFGKEFIVMPQIDRRTKAGKEAYEEFLKTANGRDVITEEQYATITAMKDAVFNTKYASKLLDGTKEHSIYFTDEFTGVKCKARPDCFKAIGDRIVITDLKSCRSAMSEYFTKDVNKYSYDLQAYMYCYGVSKTFGVDIDKVDFVFIAVEKTAPYLTAIYQVGKDVLERGEALFRQYIGIYADCLKTGEFWGLNGKHGDLLTLNVPAYLANKGDDDNA